MIAYLDSSVVIRILLGQKHPWGGWARWDRAYSSTLLHLECRRVIDRLRVESVLDDEGVAQVGSEFRRVQRSIGQLPLSPAVLNRAALPMPTVVKTLDAIHLASALLLRERRYPDLVVVTHDSQQARAAQALGFTCQPD